ncbi:hypothetical protein PR202_gn00288 [Eleusine coracana subsp. coracana]|uniref:Uncharacterized protein n=1 Tax=Eleusine coracana subsp. coracana TaxID=191504 RepID=A0AAV5G295_ELECO|nr:hypothetical protein PR202_gn00183 [Eleusine coracana subsp. coracana]GJN40972.1 hypothetical protein PR202_gn00288 [Eleusine coracana subsp. coracana]
MGSKPHAQPEDPPQAQIAPPQQQPHKKQVRRRLHTSRPYQERLLNMAEARREIVTALKIHRASMRQAKEQQQQMMQLHLQQQQEVRAVQEASLDSNRSFFYSYELFFLLRLSVQFVICTFQCS